MPLTPSFAVAIPVNSSPSTFQLQDTSGGSDGAITDRQILLYTASGSLYVPAIDFPLSLGPFITISPLLQDQALNIVITWNSASGSVLYSANVIYSFVPYAEQFFYGLIQEMATTIPPMSVLNDAVFLKNFFALRVLINAAVKAITTGGDLGNAAVCISLYQILINNPLIYF